MGDTFREGNSTKIVLTHLKRIYSKRKEFAPNGSKFFPFRVDPISKGVWCTEKQTGSHKKLYPTRLIQFVY